MNKKTVSISLPKIEGVELKNATVDLKKGVVVAEYGQEDAGKDISEIAVDFGSAVDYRIETVHRHYFNTTKKHIPKLDALNILITLAEAWNSFDEFKPDWEDLNQEKLCPEFEFRNGKFEFSHVKSHRRVLNPHISNFSFKTPERAKQFGGQFIELFRVVLSN